MTTDKLQAKVARLERQLERLEERALQGIEGLEHRTGELVTAQGATTAILTLMQRGFAELVAREKGRAGTPKQEPSDGG